MQEAEIRVSIDDNEALHKLREMLDIVEQLQEGLGDLEIPGGGGSPRYRGPLREAPGGPGGQGDPEGGGGGSRFSGGASRAAQVGVGELGAGGGFRAGAVSENIGQGLQRTGASMPFGTGIPVAILGAYLGLMGRSLNARQERLSQVAQLEQLETGIKGSVDTSSARRLQSRASSRLARLGFDPASSAQLVQGIASSVGLAMKDSELTNERLAKIGASEKLGISSSVFGNLAGAISQATGTSVGEALDQSLQLRNLAEKGLDLRGAGVEDFLQSFGRTIDDFTRRGITLEAGDFAREITGIAQTTGTRGERPAQIASSLMGVARGAGGDIKGALQGFAEASLTAEASMGAGDLFGFLQNLEALEKSPSSVANIISRSAGGGRTASAVLASISGIGTRDASRMAGGVRRGRGLGEYGERVSVRDVEAGVQIGAAKAKAEKDTLETVRKDQGLNKELIRQTARMEDHLIELSNNTTVLTKVSNTAVNVMELIVDVEKKVSNALDEVKRRL